MNSIAPGCRLSRLPIAIANRGQTSFLFPLCFSLLHQQHRTALMAAHSMPLHKNPKPSICKHVNVDDAQQAAVHQRTCRICLVSRTPGWTRGRCKDMQSVPLGAQSGCSGSQSSAAAPTPRGTSHDAHAAAADAAAGSAATSHHISHTHSFIHRSFVGSFIHVHIHACTHLFICLFICSLIHLFIHLFVRSFTHSYTHPLIPSCMHSCIQSFIISSFCSFIHALFVLSIIHLLGQVINLQHLQRFGQLQG